MLNLAKFWPDQWQMKTACPNGDELSTVQLPSLNGSEAYESCWFYKDGTSEVVARYFSREQAVVGHSELLRG